MDFRKKIEIPRSSFSINHQTSILLMGSCFAENIGSLLKDHKFKINVNPFGVLYNPSSISQSIRFLMSDRIFTEKDIFIHQGVYRSFYFHSEFSSTDKAIFLDNINQQKRQASKDIQDACVLQITFGTSYVYALRDTSNIVANCHKLPASDFDRYRLSVSDIVSDWKILIEELLTVNPSLQIIFTVSPIRHWKDGPHNNQLSKSILLLAIEELQQMCSSVLYFPSYEIVLDELRDYRFYKDDMIHPNDMAIQYIWSIFGDVFFDDATKQINKQWENLHKAILHRSFNEETDEYQQFLMQTLLKLRAFCEKYPYIQCSNELTLLKNKIR